MTANRARHNRKRRTANRKAKPGARTDTGQLPGLGPYSQRMLAAAGIRNRADLERHGPVGAYVAVINAGGKPTLNLLWGIAGALSGVHWSKLESGYRASLLREYDAWCDQSGR